MSRWYLIQKPTAVARAVAQATGAEAGTHAEVFIYGDIGESWWEETVTAREFVQEIGALDVDRLTVRINSLGGSVPDGLAIHNALKRHRAHVTTINDGMAMSVASLILMAGDDVQQAENAILMIHAPWTYGWGNSKALREIADQLDTWAAAMASAYERSGKTRDEIMALLTDGVDHYYTTEQAVAEGLVSLAPHESAANATQARALSAPTARTAAMRYPSAAAVLAGVPAFHPAAPAATHLEPTMPQPATPAAAAQPQAAPATPAATAPAAAAPTPPTPPTPEQVLAADRDRRTGIRAHFTPFAGRDGMAALQQQCEDDHACTPDAAASRILVALAQGAEPVKGVHIHTTEDETDKRHAGIVAALLVRAGLADADTRKAAMASEYRGAKLLDLARASLDRAGIRHQGMDQMQLVAASFTQSTSDFPVLLENTMHRALQNAYATAADTWSRFCAIGSVSDFRAHNRYRLGSLGNLDSLNELGEFRNKTIPDGEKTQVQISTKGNIINLSRQVVINDDLGAFIGLAAMLGRVARRTIEATVYARLAENGGLGPTMDDGKPLFHADHKNIGTAAALSVEAIDADRVVMASQTDVSGNEFLDLRPAILLLPLSQGGKARVINSAEYDPDTAGKLQRPNMVNGLYRDIVDTPRLTGQRRYSFADPAEAPVLEVDFLDGAQEPFLEQQAGFTVDGTQFKARLDFGVDAIDYRGAVTNAGE